MNDWNPFRILQRKALNIIHRLRLQAAIAITFNGNLHFALCIFINSGRYGYCSLINQHSRADI